MIIENNGIKLNVNRKGRLLTFQILEQSQEATDRIQSVAEIKDEDSGITVRSNRFPSFNQANKRFYLRGLEQKKNDKIVEASFNSEDEAQEALEGLKRIVDYITPDNFPINKQHHGKVQSGGTSHCRFFFINRPMAKILCLTGHNHYPIDRINWKGKVKPVITKNKNYNYHIANLVDILNKSTVENNVAAIFAVNKVKSFFDESFKRGPSELVACWRTITGLRDCDVKITEDQYLANGGTLKVRNAFLTREMAMQLGIPHAEHYATNQIWRASPPIIVNNKHYDEHLGQVIDVLNKSLSVKDYNESVINHHKVGPKGSKFVVTMIREAFVEACNIGRDHLHALWSVTTGLRGPDFTD